MTLEQALQKAQSQGATHIWYIETGHIRVYRQQGHKWAGQTIYEVNGSWLLSNTWTVTCSKLVDGAVPIE